LRNGGPTVALIEFEDNPLQNAAGSDQAAIGKTLMILAGSSPPEAVRRQFAEAVRVARG
jgi:hypothetical protein